MKVFSIALIGCFLSLVQHIECQTCSLTCPKGKVSVILRGNKLACASPSLVNRALCLDSHDAESNVTSVLNPAACSPACENGGACVQYFGSDGTSGSYCVCPFPWKGSLCEMNSSANNNSCGNSCATTTCYNGGTCMMLNGSPQCICSYGYNLD